MPRVTVRLGMLTRLDGRVQQKGVDATTPSSGAYGLVQALPGSEMAAAGADWRTNAKTQIKWGLD
ncbi:Secreted Protein [Streptomyces leeuwenhoekii]|uniref:Secreted Protein n=1 Tax=Streptomyces leeuwenhoekii TaxID=1437453 RepID=A0A0F7VZ91_STRLW|nr:Secreted Protein [Streptomyces leeuwenhoekii]